MPGIMLFLLSLFYQQNPTNDLTKDNLKGKVKATYEIQYNNWGDKGYLPGEKYTTKYNSNGFTTEHTNAISKNINQTTYYTYASNNLLLRSITKDNNSGGNGDFYHICKYDLYGKLINEIYQDSRGNVSMEIKFQYLLSGKIGIQYNSNPYIDSVVNKFNSAGNIIETKHYSKGKLDFTAVKSYNSKNQFIRSVVYENGKITGESFEKHNAYGDVVEHTDIDGNGKIQFSWFYSYKYDKLNNWIIKEKYIMSKEGKPTAKTERKIEYYE